MTRQQARCTTGLALMALSFAGAVFAANPNPTWYVEGRSMSPGRAEPYDHYAVKDPTIVVSGGRYHVFYTGANASGGWQMLYSSAANLADLPNAAHTYLSRIGESYFAAPQVFYFEPHGLWYLIYQDGTHGAAYATSTNVGDPNSWTGPRSLGVSGNTGWDYYVICDTSFCWMYNTPSDGTGRVFVRRTNLANFPTGWGAPSVSITDTFEGVNVYLNRADGRYYLMAEDDADGRYYELWSSSSAGGPWTKVAEKWAWRGNLVYLADQWTTHVSHGELIRSGVNQRLEINDIDRCDFLIQGTTNFSGPYQQIRWDLGFIHNYPSGSTPRPTARPTPTATPRTRPTATPVRPTATPTTPPAGSTYSFVNVSSNKCLDVWNWSTADGGVISQFTCTGSNNQRWTAEDMGGGYFRFRSVHSGKCLDIAGASTADGAQLQQWACGSGQNQQFQMVDTGGGQYRLTPRHSGKAIDVSNCSAADGAKVQQWTWLNNNCQKFRRQ